LYFYLLRRHLYIIYDAAAAAALWTRREKYFRDPLIYGRSDRIDIFDIDIFYTDIFDTDIEIDIFEIF
jgi:hypothetical protein